MKSPKNSRVVIHSLKMK